MIKEIAFTVYAVTDMAKSRAFYEGVLGLAPNGDFASDGWVEYNVGPSTFALGCAPDSYKPSQDGAVIAFEIDDFDAYVKMLKEKNVPFKLEAQDFPTCQMAIIEDPDKNRVLVHKRKEK